MNKQSFFALFLLSVFFLSCNNQSGLSKQEEKNVQAAEATVETAADSSPMKAAPSINEAAHPVTTTPLPALNETPDPVVKQVTNTGNQSATDE